MLDNHTVADRTLMPEVLDNSTLSAGENQITFVSKSMGGDIRLAGLLFLPDDFDPNSKYPTIVLNSAVNQVKEQTGAVYGRKLAYQGYIALSFDHQGFGDSEGMIRHYDYAPARIEGIQDAISFLRMHNFVDRDRVFGLGVCMGASTMAYTALTDKRMKKIALIGGMLVNTMVQFTMNGRKKSDEILLSANEARQKFYETGTTEPFYQPEILGDEAKNSRLRDVREGYDYYMTERAGAQTYPNYTNALVQFHQEDSARYSARAIARFLTTPTLTIHGSKAMTRIFSILFHWAKRGPKKRVVIRGATHVDLYDRDQYVDQAISAIVKYFD